MKVKVETNSNRAFSEKHNFGFIIINQTASKRRNIGNGQEIEVRKEEHDKCVTFTSTKRKQLRVEYSH